MFRFENNILLLLLLLLLPLALLLLYYLYAKKKVLSAFGEMALVSRLSPFISFKKSLLKYVLLFIALTFLIIALANPQRGSKVEKVERKGVDLMLCVDISNSMNAEDIQ
ncbi:MAG: hypothetical protein LBC89_00325, partial [Bacteroidales bacterium]|nr:hypothetical protein [Bacteroidales bacterium]